MSSSAELAQASLPTKVAFDSVVYSRRSLTDHWYSGVWSKPAYLLLLSTLLWLFMRNQSFKRGQSTRLNTSLLSHIMGFMNYGIWYIPRLNDLASQPLYTINLLWFRIHIAMSDQIVGVINRQPKDFSFHPFALSFMANLLDLPYSISAILRHNLQGAGYMKAWHDLIKGSLNTGASLKQILECAVRELGVAMDEQAPTTTSLRNWTDELVIRVGTVAFWGPENPFTVDPSLGHTIKVFAENFHTIVLYPFPRWTASKALKAREKIFEAFSKYYKEGGIGKAPPLMQKRLELNERHGMTLEDTARLDIPIVEAVLANTVPLTLWMVHYIFSDELLHSEIRAELLLLLNGNTIEWKHVRQKCPVFVSTWYEVLRITVALPAVRTVLRDVTLKDQYFLRKNDYVIISPGIIHSDNSIWGADLSFNPRRFLIQNMLDGGKGDLRSSVRAFGGGQHLCPGRHFSFNEIMIIVATLVLRFEIKTADGSEWKVPNMNVRAPSLGIQMPLGDLKVTTTLRPEYKGREWVYDFGDMTDSTAF